MQNQLKKHAEKLRFAIVGAANTGLDFALLFLFVNLFGVSPIVGNYLSTAIAFLFSFALNRSFTFKSSDTNVRRQFILFVVVTIVGLWIIQPIIIAIVQGLLGGLQLDQNISLFIAKLLATVASLVWNYLFYSRLVFKKASE